MRNLYLTTIFCGIATFAFSQTIYTVNSASATAGNNFQNFTDLAIFLNSTTITTAVEINVVSGSGPYTEQFKIGNILGASSTNTITINGYGETLEYDAATNSTDRATVEFDGTDYVTIKNLEIKALGSTSTTHYGWAVHLQNGADYNTFENCIFEVHANSSSAGNYGAFVCSNSNTDADFVGDAASFLSIDDCNFIGGQHGITLMGSAVGVSGNSVTNSTFTNFRSYGIYAENCTNCNFESNDISRDSRTNLTSFYGIYVKGLSTNTTVLANIIHNNSDADLTDASLAYPIQLNGASSSNAAQPIVIANNQIFNINSNGNTYGIYINSSSDHFRLWYNTIVLDHITANSADVAGINITSNASDNEIKNNLIYLAHASTSTYYYGLRYSSITISNLISDYNNVYFLNQTADRNYARRSSTDYHDLADWQAASSNAFGQNSLDADPQFVNIASDLTPQNATMDDAGTPVTISVDADGVTRNLTTPDIGALEFNANTFNDDCASATLLNVGNACQYQTFNSAGATTSGILPNPSCGFYKGNDVWFQFVMPASGRVQIERENVSGNMQLALYKGSCGSLTQVECLQLDRDRTYHDIAQAGQSMYIRVYSYNSLNSGIFDLCVWEPPLAPNDYCDNAIALPMGNSCNLQSFTNAYATKDSIYSPQNPTCGFYKGGDVWFTLQMPASGRVRIEKQNGSANIQLALYSGTCGNLAQINCLQLDDDRTYHNKYLAGQTLYLRAYNYSNEEGGTFDLCVWEPPLAPNDYCDNAIALPVGNSCNMQSFTNAYATKDTIYSPQNPSCGFFKGGDVWFTLQMPASGRLRIEKINGTANIQMALYSGTCGNLNQLTCLQLDADRTYHNKYLAGQTLYLRAYSYSNEEGGTFDLCVWEPPLAPGDYCDNPIALPLNAACSLGAYSSLYSTSDSVYTIQNPSCGFYKGGDVWYTLTMPSSGVLVINRNNVVGNLQMALYSGTCGNFTELECAQLSNTLSFTDTSVAGQTLYLRGFGYSSEEGAEFEICAFDPTCLTTITNVQTTPASCTNIADGSISITANCANCIGSLEYSINNGASFQSSNSFSNLSNGVYKIVVRDAGDSTCRDFQNGVIVGNTGTPVVYYYDNDGDNFGRPDSILISCAGVASNFTLNNTDCNDNDINVWQDSTLYVDADGDGYDVGTAQICMGSTVPNGYSFTTNGTDCDDLDSLKNTGNIWYLDDDGDDFWIDQQFSCGTPGPGWRLSLNAADSADCDDSDINVWQDSILFVDNDGDGYDAGMQSVCIGLTAPTGYKFTTLGTDCDDNNSALTTGQDWFLDADSDDHWINTTFTCASPGIGWRLALNLADSIDCDDNDNSVWQDSTLFVDADGDGYDAGTAQVCIGLTAPTGYKFTTLGTDCDDNNSALTTGQDWFLDADSDDHWINTTFTCASPGIGWRLALNLADSTDCDDNDNSVWQDSTLYVDNDGDGYDAGMAQVCIGLTAPTGYKFTTLGTDCDDSNGALTIGQDWFLDADGDNFWVSKSFTCASPGVGWRLSLDPADSADCDDTDNSLWQDSTLFVDNDGDGYDAGTAQVCIGLSAPSGYKFTTLGTDCDDNNSALTTGQDWFLDADSDNHWISQSFTCASPGAGWRLALNHADSTDCNDNNNSVWQDSTLYVDNDGDGYDAGMQSVCIGLTAPTGYKFTTLGTDCDDNNSALTTGQDWFLDADSDNHWISQSFTCASPGAGWRLALNLADSTDCNDNDNSVWQDSTLYVDNDGDGYDAGMQSVCIGLTAPTGYKFTTLGSDCSDGNNSVWQGANLYIDADGDGYDVGQLYVCYGSTIPTGFSITTLGFDCNDNNPGINPGAAEICGNGIDEDCFGGDMPCGTLSCGVNVNWDLFAPTGIFASAGANRADAYYWGLSFTKKIKINTTGGTGPFNYSWSNSGNYILKGNNNKDQVGLYYPTGSTWIFVEITDLGNANCVTKDSVFIEFIDFTCNKPFIWFYQLCNLNTNNTVCVATTQAMRDSVSTGNYTFGSCGTPVTKQWSVGLDNGIVLYPNPAFNVVKIEMGVSLKQDAVLQIHDMSGKLISTRACTLNRGLNTISIDVSEFSQGMYFVKVSLDKRIETAKFNVLH